MAAEQPSLDTIFCAAIEIASEDERAAYLARACGDDHELRHHVEKLLDAHLQAGSFLEEPAVAPRATGEFWADDPPTSDPRPMEGPGTLIGPYKLLQQIGEGGMGIVYLAEQLEPVRRKVALKIIKPGMDSKQVIARFEAERQALAMMDHTNIAKVFDAGTTAGEPGCVSAGRPYFVLELVHGVPITTFCDENGLTPRERLELFVPVCQAIQHAHQKGIIHRDVKPSNVLVTMYDDKPVPKVIDFGVAKAIEQRLTEKTLFTQFGVLVGTFEYMSPEQAEMNAMGVDTRSDIYSLGVLLYELLTGTTPLQRERLREAALDELIRLIKEEEPPRPSVRLSSSDTLPKIAAARKTEPAKLSKLLRREIDWIVMKCLEKDRSRRYETANGLARDVERYLHDETVEACPPSASYRLRKFARKNRKFLGVAGGCMLAALLGAANLVWIAQKRSETAGRVEEALQRAGALQAQNKWPEALEAAQRAKELLQLGGGSTDLRERVQGVVADLEMIMRLEDIRLEKAGVRDGGLGDLQDVSSLYAETFRNYGIDVDTLDAAEAGKRIRARPVRVELAAALDHWVHLRLHKMPHTGDQRDWQHLVAVARAADPDPWRNQLRAALGQLPVDKKILQDLAASAEFASQSAPTLLLLGNSLADTGAVQSAVSVLRQAQQWHPDSFWINYELADYLQQVGKPVEALRFRTAALALRPHSARTQYFLGLALLRQGALKQAIAAFNEAVRLMPEALNVYIDWGDALKEKNALEEAVAAFQEASRLKPDEPGIYINWGSALKHAGALDEAVAAYDKASATLQAHAAPARALWRRLNEGRAETLLALDRFDEAEQTYQRALELDPADYWNWGIAAMLRLYRGDLAGYRLLCREMLARFNQTKDPLIAYRTAETCLLGPDAVPDLGPVLQLAARAVTDTEQHFRYRWFLLAKGMADYRAGQDAEAIEHLNQTLSLGREAKYLNIPTIDTTAHAFLAMVHHRLGQADLALQELDLATLRDHRYKKTGGKTRGQGWYQLLPFEIVRREAGRLVQDKAKAAGEALRPSNGFTGPASSGRLVCAPGPMALYFYRRPAPQNRRPKAMFLYTPNQTCAGPVGVALTALALLALDTPRAQPGFQAPLAFDAGSNPVSVAVGDLNHDGIADLVVANHDSNNVSVLLGKGDGTFAPAVNYAAGTGPNAVAVADLNGDGSLDVIVANMNSRNVSVLLGNGDGTFQAAVNYAAGGALYGVAVADFNGDGKPDLAVANSSKASVSVFLGNGDGTFQAAVNYSAGQAPSSVAVGDFNHDGIPDLVVSNNVTFGSVNVLLGKGDGTFQEAVKYAAGSGAIDVAVADLNGDGNLDLAVANGNNNKVNVLLGNGDGTFQAAQTYVAGVAPAVSVAVADFNGDGVPDLVLADPFTTNNDGQGGSVAVLLGKGDGTFQAALNYAAGRSPDYVAVGDFNGDGKPDLAVANADGNNVGLLLGRGDGSFQAAPSYSAQAWPTNMAVGDFNRDGIPDLAVPNIGGFFPLHSLQAPVSILQGNGDGTFQAAVNYQAGSQSIDLAVGDFNGDGILDLVASNLTGTVSVLLGNGDGTFQHAVNYPLSDTPSTVAMGDFNGDGIPDLAVANPGLNHNLQGTVSILLGNGDGTFKAAEVYAAGIYTYSVAVGDFNGDGIPDLVVANTGGINNNYHGGSVGILLGKGDGTFQAAVHYAPGISAVSVGVEDFNGDGIQDLAVADLLSNNVCVMLGKGDGSFQAPVNYAVGYFSWGGLGGAGRCVAVRDLNGDGIPDLTVSYFGGVRVLLGNGDGTFQKTPISYVVGSFPYSVAVGDFNGDGLPDLAVPSAGLNQVSILLNDGKWGP
jgi:serine/threonine protein kinase/tetratricopeptide (TPR) repeat protein